MSEKISQAEYRTLMGIATEPPAPKPAAALAEAMRGVQKRQKERAPTEHAEQSRLMAWVAEHAETYPALNLLFAIPNGAKLPFGRNKSGQRFSREATKLKREGLKSGIPDIFLATPRPGLFAGLFIEMKRAKKSLSRVSEAQQEMIELLRIAGYRVEVCYGWESARDVLLDYLGVAQ